MWEKLRYIDVRMPSSFFCICYDNDIFTAVNSNHLTVEGSKIKERKREWMKELHTVALIQISVKILFLGVWYLKHELILTYRNLSY